MRLACYLSLIALLTVKAPAAEVMIDNFDAGVEGWTPTLQYGGVDQCRASAGEGVEGSGALRVDFILTDPATNHILYRKDVDLDLSWSEGVSFDVKGVGEEALIFLFLVDSQGNFHNYGPHGSNPDFHTGYADWHTLHVSFERDRTCQGGALDFGDVKQVGFFIWSMGPKTGTVWFDNLRTEVVDKPAGLKIWPSVFSPNGDGVQDAVRIHAFSPRDARISLEVVDAAGNVVAALLTDEPVVHHMFTRFWDGMTDGNPVPDGQYTVRATFSGREPAELTATVTVDTSHKWPPVRYEVEPFFPIGVWFEGATGPTYSGAPTDPQGAKRFYDRAFADLAAHGFNAATVPNCPESLWETLLQSAQEHGIGICLEVAPLVALVNRPDPVTEQEVYAAVRRVVDKIGKYESLLRYQIRDEPDDSVLPNWILVQRILAALDPKRPAFSCFCSFGALARVSAQTTLSEAVFDIYPHWQSVPPPTLGGFLGALDNFRDASRGNTMWVVLQAFAVTHAPNSWRYPTAEELRAVTYLSLAAGVKGVFYFLYSHMPGYLDGMVAADGTPQPIYAHVTKLADELKRLAPLLLSLTPAQAPATVEGQARVGSFTSAEGARVLIVASPNPGAPVTVRVSVPGNEQWADALTNEVFTPEAGLLSVPLETGGGRVLVQR